MGNTVSDSRWPTIAHLPDELLIDIYLMLPTFSERRAFMRTCRQWYRLHCCARLQSDYTTDLTLPVRVDVINHAKKPSRFIRDHIVYINDTGHGPAQARRLKLCKTLQYIVPGYHPIRLPEDSPEWFVLEIQHVGLSCFREGKALIPWTELHPLLFLNVLQFSKRLLRALAYPVDLAVLHDDGFTINVTLERASDVIVKNDITVQIKCQLKIRWGATFDTITFFFTWSNPSNFLRIVMHETALLQYPFGLIEALAAWPHFKTALPEPKVHERVTLPPPPYKEVNSA
jgi:hypothetical protein